MKAVIIFIIAVVPALTLGKGIRNVVSGDSHVTKIHTCVGFSTVLQFDARPTSLVIGDQDAFKVEYVGNSVTIKPLVSRAKTNLFVFVEEERFNFTLVATTKANADYAVKLARKDVRPAPPIQILGDKHDSEPKASELKTFRVEKAAVAPDKITLAVSAVLVPPSLASLIVDFSVVGELGTVDAKNFRLSQAGRLIATQSIHLRSQGLNNNHSHLKGLLVVRARLLDCGRPLELQFKPVNAATRPLSVSFVLPNFEKGNAQ